jgi:hypothetical protein
MTTDPQQSEGQAHYYWPNNLGRAFLLSLEDVMGKCGVSKALNQAGLRYRTNSYPPDNLTLDWSFDEMAALNQAVEDLYGTHGGRALLVRAGRVTAYHIFGDVGAVLGIASFALRLFPQRLRVRIGLNALADTFNKTSDQIVRIEENTDQFYYHVERCPICWGRSADEPVCGAGLGLVQEGLYWASGGWKIPVREVSCVARGDPACTYAISKHPVV